MNWKKNIYDTLTSCAALCDEAATTASQAKDIENYYRFIFLNLDCADICRQVAMLYVRGSENTRLLAETCIEICEKCAEEAGRIGTEQAAQVVAICLQTIQSCIAVLGMDTPVDRPAPTIQSSASLFYGIDLRETLYN
jgi:hypothetical protein